MWSEGRGLEGAYVSDGLYVSDRLNHKSDLVTELEVRTETASTNLDAALSKQSN